MGSMHYHLFSDAPTMILPPPQDSPFGSGSVTPSHPAFSSFAPSSNLTCEPSELVAPSSSSFTGTPHRSSWTPTSATTPILTNPSRKRSRDESALLDDEDTPETSYFPLTPAPPSIPEEEPIYGEGMTLLNPKTGLALSAESQTGTWYEEKVEAASNTTSVILHPRPEINSRKSQRLDVTAPGLDDIAAAAATAQADSPPKSAPAEPTIDESTQILGIGWTRMSDSDPDVQAAARGWAKYIDNHFAHAVHGAKIMLKSKGLNAYLVAADEGFFLFKEDLSEGRLVSRTWELALANLMAGGGNVIFEGETLSAREASASPPATHDDGKIMAEDGEAQMTNGHVEPEQKVMALNGMTNGHNHEESKLINGMGQVDGGMDLD